MGLMLVAALLLQAIDTTPPARPPRTVAIDERLATDAKVRVGDRIVLAPTPGGPGDTVVVAALIQRRADPSEVARAEYRVRMHLDELQRLTGYGDRVDRFAVATPSPSATDSAIRTINTAAFGFRAYRSHDIAVETSRTFLVVSRFHRAIGVITIVASAIFLLCIMLLKVDERRRDVAALRLMGISASSIVKSVMVESAVVAVIAANLYVIFFNVSWGPVMWVMLGEMFPNQIRGSALAVCGFAQWFANYLIAQSFPVMASGLGLAVSYTFYAVCAVISFFLVKRFIHETKGKELEQMEG